MIVDIGINSIPFGLSKLGGYTLIRSYQIRVLSRSAKYQLRVDVGYYSEIANEGT